MAEEVKFYPAYWGGNLIFVSGCQGQNDETVKVETDVFEEQMIIALDKVRYAMEEAGKTELEYYQKYAPALVEDPPASTFMQVNLAKPEFLVEIDVVGVVSRGS